MATHYGTLADAATYHEERGNAPWAASTDPQRTSALVRASEWLDGVYRSRWPGQKAGARAQVRDWPRINAFDAEHNAIASDEVPDEVERATYAAALRELGKPGSLSPDVVLGQSKVLTAVKGIVWTPLRSFATTEDMAPTLTEVERVLSGLIGSRGATEFLVRA
ncbi:MAG: DnaT-like ssDNA-binding protein [Shinella sp.]|uniref:DnaT-like ssDNA-binding protein n=1 Tax=Shinella sp. TaxID=1870904 RepID=UPI003C76199E